MTFAELLQNILLILYVAVYVYALTLFSLVNERTKLWNLGCKQLKGLSGSIEVQYHQGGIESGLELVGCPKLWVPI